MKESDDKATPAKPEYTSPTVTVMNEEEVLTKFQLTSAMAGWWVPAGTPVG